MSWFKEEEEESIEEKVNEIFNKHNTTANKEFLTCWAEPSANLLSEFKRRGGILFHFGMEGDWGNTHYLLIFKKVKT